MTTRPVAVRVSQATRLVRSSARQASRIASEIWSAILSGWPSVTDSEVNRKRFLDGKVVSLLKVHEASGSKSSTAWPFWLEKSLGPEFGGDPGGSAALHADATERTAMFSPV